MVALCSYVFLFTLSNLLTQPSTALTRRRISSQSTWTSSGGVGAGSPRATRAGAPSRDRADAGDTVPSLSRTPVCHHVFHPANFSLHVLLELMYLIQQTLKDIIAYTTTRLQWLQTCRDAVDLRKGRLCCFRIADPLRGPSSQTNVS